MNLNIQNSTAQTLRIFNLIILCVPIESLKFENIEKKKELISKKLSIKASLYQILLKSDNTISDQGAQHAIFASHMVHKVCSSWAVLQPTFTNSKEIKHQQM